MIKFPILSISSSTANPNSLFHSTPSAEAAVLNDWEECDVLRDDRGFRASCSLRSSKGANGPKIYLSSDIHPGTLDINSTGVPAYFVVYNY